MGPGPETRQKILMKCGGNGGSGFQEWRNLVEKVNAKKIWLLFTRDWENWGRILKRFRTYVPFLRWRVIEKFSQRDYSGAKRQSTARPSIPITNNIGLLDWTE